MMEEQIYRALLSISRAMGLQVIDYDFGNDGLPRRKWLKGMICGNLIGLDMHLTEYGDRCKTLAHELGHAILRHGDLISNPCGKSEAEADKVGAELIGMIKRTNM